MFTVLKELPNDGSPSSISEVSFHPDGHLFGATFQQKNEVRLYDTHSLSLVRTLKNPSAMLNVPHGLLITQNHIIVSNKGVFPSGFLVFRLDDEADVPVHTYTTPYDHLAEAHSIVLNGRRLVVTYCEGSGKKGAIVSYDYDDESGRISGPIDICDAWFRRYGDAKGISFDETGQKLFITVQSDMLSALGKIRAALINGFSVGHLGRTLRNGIVAFGIDQQGRFTRRPIWKRFFPEFCRLENIHICRGKAVVTNADAGCVYVYDLQKSGDFTTPACVLGDAMVFPHGVKFSPDGALLVVTNNGIKVENHKVRWNTYVTPRMDRLIVFKLNDSEFANQVKPGALAG